MLVDTLELCCFVSSRLDGRALETVVTLATAGEGPGAQLGKRAVVYVHPYPPLGGQLRNNVVNELGASLHQRVAVSVAFSLRGAGRSEGRTSWTGSAELEDLRSILDALGSGRLPLHPQRHTPAERRSLLVQVRARGFLPAGADDGSGSNDGPAWLPLPPIAHTLLCGYSYGSMLAAAIAPDEYPRLGIDYALVSFPYSVLWLLALQRRGWYLQRLTATVCAAAAAAAAAAARQEKDRRRDTHIPQVLLVAGSADNFTSMATYSRWWAQLRTAALQAVHPQSPAEVASRAVEHALTVAEVPNADHGWLRREQEVSDAVAGWWLPLRDRDSAAGSSLGGTMRFDTSGREDEI
ncbi:hypothetical protein H4R21_002892 [Coemansia helicoidea]|uniref:Uncharacterized protein n=1 Tax=Coemansia helicoidea TaxID=1286919 RepID=A0ACC1L640_9FUNG|nr:hypothetical protein H4R21_002892 [Coemansia helicoidea]